MAYGRSQKNVGPNVRYCFLGFNENELRHKFHGLVGPPAGIFEKNSNLQNQEEKFWYLRMALNHVLIAQKYSRRRELSKSYLNIFYLRFFDRFMAYRRSKHNFGPNVIYCFFGNHSFMFLRERKRKCHGLVGPPAAIFWKKQPAKQRRKILIFKNSFKSRFDSARI